MPKFKKNTSPFMMKGYTYPGTSPMKTDGFNFTGSSTGGDGFGKYSYDKKGAPPPPKVNDGGAKPPKVNVKKGLGKRMLNIGGKFLKRAAVPVTLWEVGKAVMSGNNKSIVDATLSGLGITNPTPTGKYKPLSISPKKKP